MRRPRPSFKCMRKESYMKYCDAKVKRADDGDIPYNVLRLKTLQRSDDAGMPE